MPNPYAPEIRGWVDALDKIVDKADENTYFVGHSIGCQAILRYLEKLPPSIRVGGVILVAGWFTLIGLKTKEERKIAKPWVQTPINFDRVKRHTHKFVVILSDNDPFVPMRKHKKLVESKLGAKVVVLHNKGHFSSSDKITKLPEVLKSITYFDKKR
ncbi:alpha/beta hydrolase, partial [Candidatus Woesearchaeota archaeon]|nr:alpha/beta hydrolase [Candidatus Woesearchaeota archaeon]